MGTFSDQAQAKAEELEFLILELRADVTASKHKGLDPAVLDMLTRLQSRMMIIKTDTRQFRAATAAAIQCGEFRDRERDPRLELRYPFPDRQCAAANDHSMDREFGQD